MIIHYLKVGIRQLLKQKTRTLISILGIAAGLICFSICNYYNRILSSGNKALSTYGRMAEIRTIDAGVSVPYQINIKPDEFRKKIGMDNFEAVAFYVNSTVRVTLNDALYCQTKETTCNPDYFKVYPPQCVTGSLNDFHLSQNTAIVTTDFVKKYFGKKSPLGQSIQKENGEVYTITGVIQPYPAGMNNYTESYEIFIPFKEEFSFGNHKLLLKDAKDAQPLSERLARLNLFPDKPESIPYILLDSQSAHRYGAELWIAIIGFLVFMVGIINFFFFSIGSFSSRFKEFSLRGTLGGKRSGLFAMLFIELSIIILLAAFVTLSVIETLLPWIIDHLPNEARRELQINTSLIGGYIGEYIFYLLLVSAFVAFFAVWHISRKVAVQGMKGGNLTGRRHIARNILLGSQLFFSLLFVIGTVGVQLQILSYSNPNGSPMNQQEKEDIVVLNIRSRQRIHSNMDEFMNFLRSRRWNEKMAYTCYDYIDIESFTEILMTTDEYFDLMKIKKQHQPDEPFCYVNPELNSILQNDSMPGIFRYYDQTYPVKGIAQLNADSPSARTIAILPFPPGNKIEKIYIRMTPDADRKQVIAELKEEMNKYLPVNEPYEFTTLYDEQTGMNVRFLMYLFVTCSVICILITILGIYGAISIDANRRQKEVSIRKINGARIADIYWLFSKSYLILFIISSTMSIALCLFILIMGSQNNIIQFSYATPWLWITPLIFMATVILSTISWRIYRISLINPADILKYE